MDFTPSGKSAGGAVTSFNLIFDNQSIMKIWAGRVLDAKPSLLFEVPSPAQWARSTAGRGGHKFSDTSMKIIFKHS